MDFHEELFALYTNWTHGRITKRTALIEFENLMQQVNLLPKDYILDPNLTDEIFISLLNQAFALTPESLAWLKEQAQALPTSQAMAIVPKTMFQCPVCRKNFASLFNEINVKEQEDENQIVPAQAFRLNPPRCEACAREWLAMNVFKTKSLASALDSQTLTLTEQERQFFHSYEEQLKEPDKQ